MKVGCFSAGGEQLTLNNIATPSGWRYFEITDFVGMAEYEPDVVFVGGWFVREYGDWQVFRNLIGRADKVIVQWFGSDVLGCRYWRDRGQRTMFIDLDSDRYVHIPPTPEIKKEIEDWLGIRTTEPLNTPAEESFERMERPRDKKVAIYMPPGRQDFFRLPIIRDAFAGLKGFEPVLFHFLPELEPVNWDLSGFSMSQAAAKLVRERDAALNEYESALDNGHKPEELAALRDGYKQLKEQVKATLANKRFAIPRSEYRKIVEECFCLLRIPEHDAYSITAAEFLSAGRPVVSDRSLPDWPAMVKSNPTPNNVARALKAAVKKQVTEDVSAYYRDRWDPSQYKERVAERCRTKWEGFSFE